MEFQSRQIEDKLENVQWRKVKQKQVSSLYRNALRRHTVKMHSGEKPST